MPTYNEIYQEILTEYANHLHKQQNLALYDSFELGIDEYSDRDLSQDKADEIRCILRNVANKGGSLQCLSSIESILGVLQGKYGHIGAEADSYEVIAVSNMTKPDQERLDALVSAVKFDSHDSVILLGQAGLKNFEIMHRIQQTTGIMPKLVVADISSDTVIFWSTLQTVFNELQEGNIGTIDLASRLPEKVTSGREEVAKETLRIREAMGRVAFGQILKNMSLTQANWEEPKLFMDLSRLYPDAQFIVWSSDIGSFADPVTICQNLGELSLKYLLSCDHVVHSNPKAPQLFDVTRHALTEQMLSHPSQASEGKIFPVTSPGPLTKIEATDATNDDSPTMGFGL